MEQQGERQAPGAGIARIQVTGPLFSNSFLQTAFASGTCPKCPRELFADVVEEALLGSKGAGFSAKANIRFN